MTILISITLVVIYYAEQVAYPDRAGVVSRLPRFDGERHSTPDTLCLLSYNTLVMAFAFSVAGGFLFQSHPDVTRAMGLTATITILVSTATYRLSNH